MVEGLAPPTRAVVHSQETICRRLRIQYASLHMCGVNQFWIIVFFTDYILHVRCMYIILNIISQKYLHVKPF